MLQPRNPKEVKQFLGLVGYFRKFVPMFVDISRNLTSLTKKEIPLSRQRFVMLLVPEKLCQKLVQILIK